MIRLLVFVVLLTVAGCDRGVKPIVPSGEDKPRVALTCTEACLTPCVVDNAQWPQWKSDPTKPGSWKDIGEDIAGAFNSLVKQCDLKHRCACVSCLVKGQRIGLYAGDYDLTKAGCTGEL